VQTDWTPYRDSAWAIEERGCSRARQSAFWQFIHSNGIPHIRVGRRKTMFSEPQLRDWLARRSSTGEARSGLSGAIGMAALGISNQQFCPLSVP